MYHREKDLSVCVVMRDRWEKSWTDSPELSSAFWRNISVCFCGFCGSDRAVVVKPVVHQEQRMFHLKLAAQANELKGLKVSLTAPQLLHSSVKFCHDDEGWTGGRRWRTFSLLSNLHRAASPAVHHLTPSPAQPRFSYQLLPCRCPSLCLTQNEPFRPQTPATLPQPVPSF